MKGRERVSGEISNIFECNKLVPWISVPTISGGICCFYMVYLIMLGRSLDPWIRNR